MSGPNGESPDDYQGRIKRGLESDDNPDRIEALGLLKSIIQRSSAARRPVEVISQADKAFIKGNQPYDILMISVPVRIRTSGRKKVLRAPPVVHRGSPIFELVQKRFDHFTVCVRDEQSGVEAVDSWADHLLSECDRCIPFPSETDKDNGVKFVVVNELGHPNFWIGDDVLTKDVGRMRIHLQGTFNRLHAGFQKIATDRNVVIIAGTMHDAVSFYNWGPIFFPNPRSTTDHFKLTSAFKSSEIIKTPEDFTYPIYNMGQISFTVLVCYDAFDLNIFFERFQINRAGINQRPNIVFVPSYHIQNTSQKRGSSKKNVHYMREACSQLSAVTDCVVVFCNQAFDSQPHGVFVGGEELNVKTDKCTATARIDASVLGPIRDRSLGVWSEIESLLRTSGRSYFRRAGAD